MQVNLQHGPLAMGVIVGGESVRTGILSDNLALVAMGVLICGSSLILGYVVALSRTNKAKSPKDAKAK